MADRYRRVKAYAGVPPGIQSALALGNPLLYAAQYGLLMWFRADVGVTLGTTPRAGGTAPPAVTWSGALTPAQELLINIDSTAGGTARGQATFRWSDNGGASYTAGVLTAATTDLATAQGTVTVAWPVGTYNVDQTWKATVTTWSDQSGNANHAVQATAANQPLFSLAGFGGYSALNSAGGTIGLATPSVSIGVHSVLFAMSGTTGTLTFFVFGNVSSDSYMQNTTVPSSLVSRGANASRKEVSASWLTDGVRKTAGRTFDGTHATHLIYVNGLDVIATNGSATADPGTGTESAPFYVGTRAGSFGAVAIYREFMVFTSALPPAVMLALHRGIAARANGAF